MCSCILDGHFRGCSATSVHPMDPFLFCIVEQAEAVSTNARAARFRYIQCGSLEISIGRHTTGEFSVVQFSAMIVVHVAQ